jgi:hypothetical protein
MWNTRGVSARRRTGRRDAGRTVPEDATDHCPCWVGRADPRRRRCAARGPGRAGFPLVRPRPGTCRDYPGIATRWRVCRDRQHRGRLGALGGGACRGHSGCANGWKCRTWLRRHTRTPAFSRPQQRRFPWRWPRTIGSLLDNVSTHSWALISSPDQRAAAFGVIRRFLEQHPATRDGAFELPMQTVVLRTTRT